MESITCASFNGLNREKYLFFIEIIFKSYPIDTMYSQFGSAVKRVFSNDSDSENNNILATAHHSKPIFEKINPDKYFRITVSMTITKALTIALI